jgi:hypothetical protein
MAPEQTERAGHVSAATDIWALGLVVYRMLTGGSYWSGDSLQQLYRQILMDPITSAVERAYGYGVQLPPAFDQWFLRCVTRNPQERFQSAGQSANELANALGISIAQPIGFTPPPPSTAYAPTHGPDTAQPVMHVTPGQTPHPATMYGGATPYPNPHITPHPHSPSPYTTPMPGPTPFGAPGSMGTQVASPDMLAGMHGSSMSGAMVSAAPPKKGGNGALIAGVLVGLLAVGGGIAFFATSGGKHTDDKGAAAKGPDTDETEKTAKKPAKDEDKKDELPLADVVEELNPFLNVGDKGFALQKHEVSHEEYAQFLAKAADKKKAKKPLDGDTLKVGAKDGKLPITWVTYEMAEAFCQSVNARLPTAQEWDAAVAGPSKQKYPWGNDWTAKLEGVAVGKGSGASVFEVGSSPKDHGPYGHMDLAGNVQEWTSTDTKIGKMLRGADVGSDKDEFEQPGDKFTEATAPANAVNFAKAGEHLGFRCARDAK